MTQDEATREAERLAAESPDRETHRFIPRQADDGSWAVARIGLPPADASPGTPETRADEKPPTADDPRTVINRNIGPYGAGF